jgi:hypothetical protein
VRAAFNVERATKRFYDRFKKERKAFEDFMDGIDDLGTKQEYVSVMLNRLMFIYFLQQKSFLDGDIHYLRNRMQMMREQHGEDQFYSFYRHFLLRLFHEGLGGLEHAPELEALIGHVPYLNGGIFEQHIIEQEFSDIQIPDEAFERVLDFFDQYQWHLDDRALHDDKEINPDVLGYIFEKYINQKQMGAYYTKEDITGYISRNTILPHLFDRARKIYPDAFRGDDSVWGLLQVDPRRYIYQDMSVGVDLALPEEIAAGVEDVTKRDRWNRRTLEEYGLPTEIWRETVARRKRYEEIETKLASGEVTEINELITLNLDIQQFAQDVIENIEEPATLQAFWKTIREVTVLDPTCGSGAFLFAALNILEPLYEACLNRMDYFVDENPPEAPAHKFKEFKETLAQVDRHHNKSYYILKSIVVSNLYGVDIMPEAVEIAKLRLFLKLVAQVERVDEIEPLPDIDFNIRAGNTLVGFATREDVERSVKLGITGGKETVQSEKLFAMPEENAQLKQIEEKAEEVDRLYKLFRQHQTEYSGEVRPEDKRELQKRLGELEMELNILLSKQYVIHNPKSEAYDKWLVSHTPFHWFVEFYSIMHEGGFDVIIGNPPYVENSKIKKEYSLTGYISEACGNLYSLIVERSTQLASKNGRFGMIVPMSIVSTERMRAIRKILLDNMNMLCMSNYSGDAHPSVLFTGVKMRLTIVIGQNGKSSPQLFTTKFMRWLPIAREYLFDTIVYAHVPKKIAWNGLIPKANDQIDIKILEKIFELNKTLDRFVLQKSAHSVYSHRIVAHFVKCFDFIPHFKNERDGKKKSEDYKVFSFKDQSQALLASAFLNSSLFYYFYLIYSDAYHCGRKLILGFPCNLDLVDDVLAKELRKINKLLMTDMVKNSVRRKIKYRGTGFIEYDEFYPRLSKPIIDKIDCALASHYGLSDDELDFIINYDVKYRMGKALENVAEKENGTQAKAPATTVEKPVKSEPTLSKSNPLKTSDDTEATDYGLYKCSECGSFFAGYEREEHVNQVHGGQAVNWKKMSGGKK